MFFPPISLLNFLQDDRNVYNESRLIISQTFFLSKHHSSLVSPPLVTEKQIDQFWYLKMSHIPCIRNQTSSAIKAALKKNHTKTKM